MANLELREKIIQKMMKDKKLSHQDAEKEFSRVTKDVPEKDWGKVAGGISEVQTFKNAEAAAKKG